MGTKDSASESTSNCFKMLFGDLIGLKNHITGRVQFIAVSRNIINSNE
jgi:hypothetical protein